LVSESKSKVPKAGEAATEGARPLGHTVLQWHDAQHPGLQRFERLSTVSTSKFNQPVSPGPVPNGSLILSGHDAAILDDARFQYGCRWRSPGLDGNDGRGRMVQQKLIGTANEQLPSSESVRTDAAIPNIINVDQMNTKQ
uniref:Uncharacterized protein n=1 Tax=Anopheles coluzzii TaxID=1518534 RepID=A0A8W7PTF1_ANOCL